MARIAIEQEPLLIGEKMVRRNDFPTTLAGNGVRDAVRAWDVCIV